MTDIDYKKLAKDHDMNPAQFTRSIFNIAAALGKMEINKKPQGTRKITVSWDDENKTVMTIEIKEPS